MNHTSRLIKTKVQLVLALLLLLNTTGLKAQSKKDLPVQTVPGKVWSVEKANNWYKQYKWINGADFLPSTAINQLEMWQKSTFD